MTLSFLAIGEKRHVSLYLADWGTYVRSDPYLPGLLADSGGDDEGIFELHRTAENLITLRDIYGNYVCAAGDSSVTVGPASADPGNTFEIETVEGDRVRFRTCHNTYLSCRGDDPTREEIEELWVRWHSASLLISQKPLSFHGNLEFAARDKTVIQGGAINEFMIYPF